MSVCDATLGLLVRRSERKLIETRGNRNMTELSSRQNGDRLEKPRHKLTPFSREKDEKGGVGGGGGEKEERNMDCSLERTANGQNRGTLDL